MCTAGQRVSLTITGPGSSFFLYTERSQKNFLSPFFFLLLSFLGLRVPESGLPVRTKERVNRNYLIPCVQNRPLDCMNRSHS